ncbi:MAG: flagellar hook-length control protein FliK [Gammaproteobacteria bacterium]
MDIKPTMALNQPPTLTKIGNLELKLHQVIEAKVIQTQIALNTLSLKEADLTMALRSQQPLTINLKPDQSLQLQVVKLIPELEFKVLALALDAQTSPRPVLENPPQLLKLTGLTVPTLPDNSAKTPSFSSFDRLMEGQRFQTRVVEIVQNKVKLELISTIGNANKNPSATVAAKAVLTLNLEQLNLPATSARDSQAQRPLIEIGQMLQLQVVKTGSTPTFAVTFAPADDATTIAQAFKQLLPVQDSPVPLLNQLTHTLSKLGADTSVSEALQQIAREILQNLPQHSQLSDPSRLKQAFQDSGLFLESKLLDLLSGKLSPDLASDFKAKLYKLAQQLSLELAASTEHTQKSNASFLEELMQKTRNALAKLTLDQMNALPKDESPKQTWALEIPYYNDDKPDSVYIEIERDQSRNGERSEKNWAVNITITPPNLGTIRCTISCYDGSVNTRFQSEAASTVELINAHLDCLKKQLENKGLSVGFMDAQEGQALPTVSTKTPLTQLLSEKV